MSEAKQEEEFRELVKSAHDAIDNFAEGRAAGDWFERNLDGEVVRAVSNLLYWGLKQSSLGEALIRPVFKRPDPPAASDLVADLDQAHGR